MRTQTTAEVGCLSKAGSSPSYIMCRPRRLIGRGYTLIEVVVIMVVVCLLVAVLFPALANRQKSQRVTCINNLKQLSLTLRMCDAEETGNFPWDLEARYGGMMLASNVSGFDIDPKDQPLLWGQLAKDLMGDPKPLICPADRREWFRGSLSDASFTNRTFGRQLNTSYGYNINAKDRDPRQVMLVDRNLAKDPITKLAEAQNFAFLIVPNASNEIAKVHWTDGLHEHQGNIALTDGSANQVTDTAMRNLLKLPNHSNVWLMPYNIPKPTLAY